MTLVDGFLYSARPASAVSLRVITVIRKKARIIIILVFILIK